MTSWELIISQSLDSVLLLSERAPRSFAVGKDAREIKTTLSKGCSVTAEGLASDKLGHDYFNCGQLLNVVSSWYWQLTNAWPNFELLVNCWLTTLRLACFDRQLSVEILHSHPATVMGFSRQAAGLIDKQETALNTQTSANFFEMCVVVIDRAQIRPHEKNECLAFI